jgi:hypothetical protein
VQGVGFEPHSDFLSRKKLWAKKGRYFVVDFPLKVTFWSIGCFAFKTVDLKYMTKKVPTYLFP